MARRQRAPLGKHSQHVLLTTATPTQAVCDSLPDDPEAIGHLDGDTAVSRRTFAAALAAAGAACTAVDEVMSGRVRALCVPCLVLRLQCLGAAPGGGWPGGRAARQPDPAPPSHALAPSLPHVQRAPALPHAAPSAPRLPPCRLPGCQRLLRGAAAGAPCGAAGRGVQRKRPQWQASAFVLSWLGACEESMCKPAGQASCGTPAGCTPAEPRPASNPITPPLPAAHPLPPQPRLLPV